MSGSEYASPSGSVFDRCVKIDWPSVWKAIGTREAHQAECDDRESLLTVIADDQGDMHMDMIRHPMADKYGGGFGNPTFRARTFIGGGRCERIRTALALLALAISEDQPNKGTTNPRMTNRRVTLRPSMQHSQNATDEASATAGRLGPVVGCPTCAKMREYICDHVHAFIDSDEIDRLMSYEEWSHLDTHNAPRQVSTRSIDNLHAEVRP